MAMPSDLSSMDDAKIADHALNAREGQIIKLEERSVLLTVFQSMGLAQRQVSETLQNSVNIELGVSLKD